MYLKLSVSCVVLCEGVSKIETGGSSDTLLLCTCSPPHWGPPHQHTRAANKFIILTQHYANGRVELVTHLLFVVIVPAKISVQFWELKSSVSVKK